MITFSHLTWDSNFFGRKIGQLTGTYESDTELFEYLSQLEEYDLIYFFNKNKKECSKAILNSFNGKKVDTKIIFRWNAPSEKSEDFSLPQGIEEYNSGILTEELESLAYESGAFSRYRIDQNFTTREFRNLYLTWIKKSLKGELADKVLVSKINDSIAGFITVKFNHNRNSANIGLLAINEKYRGLGLGKKLILAAKNVCLETKSTYLEVPTQKENKTACIFYKKNGFSISEEISVFHFWLKNNKKQ